MNKNNELTERMEELSTKVRRKKLYDSNPEQRDMFVADMVSCAPKNDRHTMEHPFFSLSKKPDLKIRHYSHHNKSNGQITEITITPSVLGMATIWDKDILIYCASQLVEAMNRNKPISRTVRFSSYSLLRATYRSDGGKSYSRLEESLDRLKGTMVKTNIETAGIKEKEAFSILDGWRIIERSKTNDAPLEIEMTLSEWFYNALLGKEVLTYSPAYFLLTGGMERRIYELARKHCGSKKNAWKIGEEALFKKTGTSGNIRKFRLNLKKIVDEQCIPDFTVMYDTENAMISFKSAAVA